MASDADAPVVRWRGRVFPFGLPQPKRPPPVLRRRWRCLEAIASASKTTPLAGCRTLPAAGRRRRLHMLISPLLPVPVLCRVGIIGAGANTKTRHIPNLQVRGMPAPRRAQICWNAANHWMNTAQTRVWIQATCHPYCSAGDPRREAGVGVQPLLGIIMCRGAAVWHSACHRQLAGGGAAPRGGRSGHRHLVGAPLLLVGSRPPVIGRSMRRNGVHQHALPLLPRAAAALIVFPGVTSLAAKHPQALHACHPHLRGAGGRKARAVRGAHGAHAVLPQAAGVLMQLPTVALSCTTCRSLAGSCARLVPDV